jgi:hypothetical protein
MADRLLHGAYLALEQTPGTTPPGGATTRIAGLTALRHRMAPVNDSTPTLRGRRTPHSRHPIRRQRAEIEMEGYASWDTLGYWLGLAVLGGQATGTGDGGTPIAYTRPYVPDVDTEDDLPDTASIWAGTPVQYWVYPYFFGKSLQLRGARDDDLMFTLTGEARARTATTQPAGLDDPGYDPIAVNDLVLYVDEAEGGTLGTTLYGGCLLDVAMGVSLYDPFKCIDGTTDFSFIQPLDVVPTLQFTALLDADMVTLLDDYHAAAVRLLFRLEAAGAVIHPTPDVTQRFRWDQSAIIKDVSMIGAQDTDGKLTVQITTEVEDDAGLPGGSGLVLAAELVNSVDVLV